MVFFSDGASFRLNGGVVRHNARYWSKKQPKLEGGSNLSTDYFVEAMFGARITTSVSYNLVSHLE